MALDFLSPESLSLPVLLFVHDIHEPATRAFGLTTLDPITSDPTAPGPITPDMTMCPLKLTICPLNIYPKKVVTGPKFSASLVLLLRVRDGPINLSSS